MHSIIRNAKYTKLIKNATTLTDLLTFLEGASSLGRPTGGRLVHRLGKQMRHLEIATYNVCIYIWYIVSIYIIYIYIYLYMYI